MEKDKKVTALYCRLSKDDGSALDSLSIRTQKAMLMEYATRNGFGNCQYSGVLRSDARTSDFSAHGCVQQTSSRIFLCSRANLLFMCCKCGKEWTPIVFLLLFYPR